jgi:hypothetical protein
LTLQELLAPVSVELFSRERTLPGDKRSLERHIHEVTGIPVEALQGSPPTAFDVDERRAWMERRKTTRPEDKAYALLGLLNVYIPPIYGEGGENAFNRLLKDVKEDTKSLGILGQHLTRARINIIQYANQTRESTSAAT